MPRTISREPGSDDVEKLLQDVFPGIQEVVRKVCARLDHYSDQTEVDEFAQRIGFLLWKNDYRVLRSFKHNSEPETWLFTIAKWKILQWLRERDGISSLDDMPPDSITVQPDQEQWLLAKERYEILQAAESKLTNRERKLYELWQDELSNGQIAEKMKITKRSVSTKKGALLKKLQKLLGE